MAGSTILDELLAAGATLTPVIRSYHRASVAESLAAVEADIAAAHTDEQRGQYSGTDDDRRALWHALLTSYTLQLPEAIAEEDVAAVASALGDDPAVLEAAPAPSVILDADWIVDPKGQVLPTDPLLSHQWGLMAIEPHGAWNGAVLSPRVLGEGVRIGIIDTGVDSRHADLGGPRYLGQWDWIDPDGWCRPLNYPGNPGPVQRWNCDPSRHGTHVAGIAAGAANSWGMTGVAPQASIQSFRVFSPLGSGGAVEDFAANVADAIAVAITQGTRVLNMSFSSGYHNVLRYALELAHFSGITLVSAAGNGGYRSLDVVERLPASLPYGLTVGATTRTNAVANFSEWGTALDVVAPGGDHTYDDPFVGPCGNRLGQFESVEADGGDRIVSARSTFPYTDPFIQLFLFAAFISDYSPGCPAGMSLNVAGEWFQARGTSMAAPHVTGIAAGVVGHHGLKPYGTEWVIKHSARALAGDRDGFGLVSFSEAIQHTRRFRVVDDTYTRASAPTANFGSNPFLCVAQGEANAYLRFWIPALPQHKHQGALLRLYKTAGINGATPTITASSTDGNWNEQTLTWNTAPPLAGSSLGMMRDGYSLGLGAPNQWIEMDVSSSVREGWNDLVLSGGVSSGICFASNEDYAPPELVVQACHGCGCRGATVYQAQLPLLEIMSLIALPLYVRGLWGRRRHRGANVTRFAAR